MLENLKILNGSISPNFSSDNYEYEVLVDDTTVSLIIDYTVSDSAKVTVYGNDYLSDGESHVLIEIYDGMKVTTYTLKVNKENSETVFADSHEIIEIEDNKFSYDLATPIISAICFISIVVLFCIIFPNNKIVKKK